MSNDCRFPAKKTELAHQVWLLLESSIHLPECTSLERVGKTLKATWYGSSAATLHDTTTKFEMIVGGVKSGKVQIREKRICGSSDKRLTSCENYNKIVGSIFPTRFERALEFFREKTRK